MITVYSPVVPDLGVGRVISAYKKHLPKYGIEFVDSPLDADVVTTHAGIFTDGRDPDVLHCHGLYPTAEIDTSPTYLASNNAVIHNARVAKYITVPSEWVADIFRRGMLLNPFIVPHGIDIEDFQEPSYDRSASYILWAKGHRSGVCDPAPVNALANKLRDKNFITTFGTKTSNVNVLGRQPFDTMLEYIRSAGIYLATTKETFGIQTLEAMACGVPVLAYDWGATPEIVTHGLNGIIVAPGDIEGLVQGYYTIQENWESYAKAAREAAFSFTWDLACQKVFEIYTQVLEPEPVKLSVVIPCYNYAHYLGNAIESVLAQETPVAEIIVVDDDSADNTAEVAARYPEVQYYKIKNVGVANARNFGIQRATGNFIACLDADDMMQPNFVSTLLPRIATDRSLGIVYGSITNLFDNGRTQVSQWPPPFHFGMQIKKRNCVPSCCIFRRAAWERAGGYKRAYTPAEDAELFARITSYGYRAEKVTEEALYIYRIHDKSLSKVLTEPDWVLDKPWSYDESVTPFAAPRSDALSYPVYNYDNPVVSIIIPVGPGHNLYAARAVDSAYRQYYQAIEIIVINDSGSGLIVPETGMPLQRAYPFVRMLETDARDAGKARNLGAEIARGRFLVWLDADDMLMPEFVNKCIQAFESMGGEFYVYTDWFSQTGELSTAEEFDIEKIKAKAVHPVTTLLPKAWHNEIGGYAEMEGWEDWDYYLRIACSGHCGARLAEALLVYDYASGMRREKSHHLMQSLIERIRRIVMACRGCASRKSAAPTVPVKTISASGIPEGYVKVEENSGNRGGHFVMGRITRTNYGRHKTGDIFPMHAQDQAAQPTLYKIVSQPVQQPIPQVVKATVTKPVDMQQIEKVVASKPQELPDVQEYAEIVEKNVDPEAVGSDNVPTDYVPPVGTLTERMLRNMTLTVEWAEAMLVEEQAGKNRIGVQNYLRSIIDGTL